MRATQQHGDDWERFGEFEAHTYPQVHAYLVDNTVRCENDFNNLCVTDKPLLSAKLLKKRCDSSQYSMHVEKVPEMSLLHETKFTQSNQQTADSNAPIVFS